MSGGTGAGPAAYEILRADAVARLTTWHPADPGQTALRAEFLDVLARHPDAMSRNGPPAHVTAGVIVLDPQLRSVLLTHHRKAEAWFQFGGHLEAGDASVAAGAAREAREESGLTDLVLYPEIVHLDRHALSATFGRCREHLDIRFAATAPTRATPTVSAESLDVRWWPIDALPPGAAADVGPLVAAAVVALGQGRAPATTVPGVAGDDIAFPADAPAGGGARIRAQRALGLTKSSTRQMGASNKETPMADETYKGEFYCVKCKEKREAEGKVVVSENGRRMAKGQCPVCGTNLNRILGKA